MRTDRRHLILGGLGLGGSLALHAPPAASPARSQEPFKISLAEWSLHRTIRAGELDPRDFAVLAREEFGLDAVEHVNTFFQDRATDFEYLHELKLRADGSGVRSLLIMCDAEGELGDADQAARRSAIENHFRWIAAAAFLGCHSIRVNAAGQGAPDEVSQRAADSLHRLGVLADPYQLDVLVENHGGQSSSGAWLAATIRAADHRRVGTLPDFGNFRISANEEYDRYRGVAELMPFARGVSAKSHGFDAEGNETHTDYARMLKIVLDAGYRGYVGIEYEGDGVPEKEGILLTKALLERVRGAWAGGR
ncbi:MAG: sugar phosphate isomerase/epimerase [Planctomycetes bacterium]|nr:sugar phosphate isomerase/epimerase [Planctomycetota bacterium]